MRFSKYLNLICFRSLLEGDLSLFCQLTGMLIRKFIGENPRDDNIKMFDFADCVDTYLDQPWRIPITGNDRFVP